MAYLLYETPSSSAAEGIVEDVEAGNLWGYTNLGSTTKASSYSNFVLIELTNSRSKDLSDYTPQDIDEVVWLGDSPSFTAADAMCKIWFLRGKLS